MGDQIKNRALVFCDNDLLFDVIAVNLKDMFVDIEHLEPSFATSAKRNELGDFDLIIIAISTPVSHHLVTLFDVLLSDRMEHVPILVISDQSSHTDQENLVSRLDFPFAPDALCDQVQDLLTQGKVNVCIP
ncbi:MAG: hypothetical protein GY832_46060 [Chloroflexi bacterium]|nr:hypothetical protein [Chloroflexota bacterium]